MGAPPKDTRITLRCWGRRILTNNREQEPHDAVVTDDAGRVLAGPFRTIDEAVAWVQARAPPLIIKPRAID